MTNVTFPDYKRYLNVLAVNNTANTITCMFGGAWSGLYRVHIRHKTYGMVDTADHLFNVSSTMTSLSPLTGSMYGGTLLTIQGTNFGSVFTDNPVEISYNGALGSTKCYV